MQRKGLAARYCLNEGAICQNIAAESTNHIMAGCGGLFPARHYMMKIIYTIMLLDMGLAPIAWQMWKKD